MNYNNHFMSAIAMAAVFNICLSKNTIAQNDELEALRMAAQAESISVNTAAAQQESFTSGALALQKLNPEISVTGDILFNYSDIDGQTSKQNFTFRGLGLHLSSYLDPYTMFKAAVEFSEDETELGEAYITRFDILPQLNITIGKFRQQFGVVNRWHKHALDQIDFPLALRQIFGNGGLNQTGVSLDWIIPGFAGFSHNLTAQITDGANNRLFRENSDSKLCSLVHYKIYRDLTDSTYLELGLTGLYGQNNAWQVNDETVDKSLGTTVAGIDLTLLWEPEDNMRYRNFTWRSEVYFLDKDIVAPNGTGDDSINSWGAYTYLESKISRTFIIGIRGDWFVPDVKDYADYVSDDGVGSSLTPIAVTHDDPYRRQIAPYITWNQSPFVHYRLEYDIADGDGTGPDEQTVWLQCIFAAGPHKHDRY